MQEKNMILVDSHVLPAVFGKVLETKQLLESGEEKSAAVACSRIGISRSAYYKYKDHVYEFKDTSGRIITVHAILNDRAGILSKFMSVLYESGANILTVNQNIPVRNQAAFSVSFRSGHLKVSVAELIEQLKSLDGVKSIYQIFGE